MSLSQNLLNILTIAVLLSCGKSPSTSHNNLFNSSIVNGKIVAIDKFQSVLSLKRKGEKKSFCTSTLISKTEVLTAAHCVILESELGDKFGVANRFLVERDQLYRKEAAKFDLSKDETDKLIKNPTAIKSDFIAYLKKYIKIKKGSIEVFSSGEKSLPTKNLNVRIESIEVEDAWLERVYRSIFSGILVYGVNIVPFSPASLEPIEKNDTAILKLNREVEGIKPTAVMKIADVLKSLSEGNDSVVTVGYGRSADFRFMTYYNSLLAKLKTKKTTARPEQKEILESNITALEKHLKIYEKSNDNKKRFVTLKLLKIRSTGLKADGFEGSITNSVNVLFNRDPMQIEKKSLYYMSNPIEFDQLYKEGRGLCSGDSGGPIFFKNQRDELIQVGVSSNVSLCGDISSFAPIK